MPTIGTKIDSEDFKKLGVAAALGETTRAKIVRGLITDYLASLPANPASAPKKDKKVKLEVV